MRILKAWKVQLQWDIKVQNECDMLATISEFPWDVYRRGMVQAVENVDTQISASGNPNQTMAGVTVMQQQEELSLLDPSLLNNYQYHVFETIMAHVWRQVARNEQEPLRMILYGEGGTGKSKVIQTVIDAFTQMGKSHGRWVKDTHSI